MNIHPDTAIGAVHLVVKDLERSIHFYVDYLGFEILEKKKHIVSLSADGQKPLIWLEEGNGKLSENKVSDGLYHLAILVPDRTSLSLALRRLLEKNYPLQGASDHGFSEALYLQDPDNNGIEIYADRPRDNWPKDTSGNITAATYPLDAEGLLKESESKTWNGLPSGTTIGHIHLHVGELSAAEHFYVDGLGFDKMFEMGRSALFLSAGGYHHHIALNTWTKAMDVMEGSGYGLKYYTIEVPDEETYNHVLENLQNTGASVEMLADSVQVKDPFGITMKIAIA
ncbi:VOC family protein [Thalassobacillus pellis]|uniref:VOC family protein n=1 Tax=Thalassobacillus pellis TaxID=748008 RepID=UPI0019612BEF|nr:VOC family protein [Thalassobacillus pellis]MBM7554202.1 catechol 2,3-dioxygenase [Thalassobacillus pellis]